MHRIACIALVLGAGACTAPATLERAPERSLHLTSALRELDGRLVEVEVAPGQRIRGILIPPEPGGTLCLHFLGSPIAASPSAVPEMFRLLQEFGVRGVGSLVFDMRGVGASDGLCDPRQIAEDALAAWREALRLVDGQAERIYLRGTSFGNLSALSLLERGAKPSHVLFIAPEGRGEAADDWRRSFGADRELDESCLALLRFDVSRLPRENHWIAPNTFLFLDAPDGSMDVEERAELVSRSKGSPAIDGCFEPSQSDLSQAAIAPLQLEADLLMDRPPPSTRGFRGLPGFCVLRNPDLDIMDLPQFTGSELDVSPSGRNTRHPD